MKLMLAKTSLHLNKSANANKHNAGKLNSDSKYGTNNKEVSQYNKTTLSTTNPFGTLLTVSNAINSSPSTTSIIDYANSDTKRSNLLSMKNDYKHIHTAVTSFRRTLERKERFHSTSHSIFSLFRDEFKRKFNSKIDKTIKQMGKTLYKPNPISSSIHNTRFIQSQRNPKKQIKLIKPTNSNQQQIETDNNNTLTHQSNIDNTTNTTNKNININVNNIQLPLLNNTLSSSSSSSSLKSKPINFTEPAKITMNKYKRIRNIKKYMNDAYIMNSKWKVKEGIYSSEGKFCKTLLQDIEFQSKLIKDEMRILLDNIQYMKTNLLNTNDIVLAIKNKDLRFQININKSIEETCAFLDLLCRYILSDYYNYSDRFIAIDGADFNDMKTIAVTNEVDCFVINIRLLCKISKFLKCCFEVYLMLIKQVDDVLLSKQKFIVVRRILERCRFNVNDIIQSGKGALKDFFFDKELIDKIEPVLQKDFITKHDIKTCTQRKRKDLMEHLKSELDFAKSEFTQKRMRIVAALHGRKEEDNLNNSGNGIIGEEEGGKDAKGKDCQKKMRFITTYEGLGLEGPMSIIVSYYYIYLC